MTTDIASPVAFALAAGGATSSLDAALLELLPAAVCVCGATGVLLHYNSRAAALWGRAPTPGDPDERFCGAMRARHPDGRIMAPEELPMAQVLRTGQPVRDREVCLERPDGSRCWVLLNIEPLHDAAGGVAGGINCFHDITPRKLAEARERDHQAMLQAVFDTTPECIKLLSVEGRLLQMNAAGLRMIGADSLDAVRNQPVFGLIAPEHHDTWRERHDRVCRGEALSWTFDMLRLDRQRRHMETHAAPVRLPDGSTAHLGITRDITGQTCDRQRLEESERRLRVLLDALPAAIYTTDSEGRLTFCNAAAQELAGCAPPAGNSGDDVDWRLYHPDGRPLRQEDCPMTITLRQGEPVHGIELLAERPDGSRVSVQPYPALLRNAAGMVVGGVNMLVDISARKQAEHRLQLLIHELNHRVKNTLATVQSIAAHTFRRDEVAASPRRQFENRLVALSKAHDLLNRGNWEGAHLGDLLVQALAPLNLPDRSRFSFDGAELRLPPGMAVSFAMALHELCSNAARHGALSVPAGRVAVSWAVRKGPTGDRLWFRWQESDGPPVQPPRKRGFGLRLIERGLARELAGSARLDFVPAGLVCEIDAPLP